MKSVHFNSVILQNYGIFRDYNRFCFNKHRTVVMGKGGSGKTTIVSALANLGAVSTVTPYCGSSLSDMYVNVSVSGNPDLIRDYKDIFF